MSTTAVSGDAGFCGITDEFRHPLAHAQGILGGACANGWPSP
jgi:hypothetical protein